MNSLFLQEIKKYIPRPEMVNPYKITLIEAWHDQTAQQLDERKKIQVQIKELEGRLRYAMELVSTQQIAPADYRQMSADLKTKIERLKVKLSTVNQGEVNITDLLNKGISNLLTLNVIYQMGDIEKKREVISSIFPEKSSFSEFGDRTGRLNEAVS